MALLIAFAVVAGAGTAVTPCVLPVLPAVLSASATGGRRRPLGIILGLTVTFTVTIVGLATVIDGVGLADGFVRMLAVIVLVAFGLSLAWPRLGELVERPLTRLARLGPRGPGDGFRSGLLVGGALGFVYAPCAGPILAAVVSVAATQGASAKLVVVALAYGVGSAAVLFLYAYGGRRAVEPLRRAGRGPTLQRALGVVMVLTAVAIATDLDVRFQTALANDVPDIFTNPTRGLERSRGVEDRLARLRGTPRFSSGQDASRYRVLGAAPDFAGTGHWFNTPGGRPLTLAGLRGHVVLIDFWTYTCINCLRTLPYVRGWYERYRRDGLVVVGVHTPEFGFERKTSNVARAVRRNRLRYPVAQDNEYATWEAWGNHYWPAKYLIDARGRVRYTHFGEGDYGETESAIRALLAEAGSRRLGGRARARSIRPSNAPLTPETYLGADRAQRFVPPPRPGTHRYPAPGRLEYDQFALGGRWRVDGESATAAGGARLEGDVVARRVYLVLAKRGSAPRRMRVLVDGRPPRRDELGRDLHGGAVTVRGQRLYELLDLPRVEHRRITLLPEPGVTGFAFTFG